MPLPVAHGLVATSITLACGKSPAAGRDLNLFVIATLLAICPDFDMFFVWVLRWSPGWHRGFSHSIAMAVVLAAFGWMLVRGRDGRAFLILLATTSSHGLIDTLTSRSAPGVELLWPFSSGRYRLGLVDYFDLNLRLSPIAEFLLGVLKISLIEALVYSPVLLAGYLISRVTTPVAAEPSTTV